VRWWCAKIAAHADAPVAVPVLCLPQRTARVVQLHKQSTNGGDESNPTPDRDTRQVCATYRAWSWGTGGKRQALVKREQKKSP
jgi:hypothetical protein